MKLTCTTCTREFEAKREDAKFCSDKCRKALSRTIIPDKIISDTGKPIISDKLTKQPGQVEQEQPEQQVKQAVEGICHGCKEPQGKLICYLCIANGITHRSLGMDISLCV